MKHPDRQWITTVKHAYLCLLAVYAIAREVLVIQSFIGSSVVTYGLFGLGMMLIAVDFLKDPKAFFHKSQWIYFLFLAICVVSVALNRQAELMANVKSIAWMVLYFFLLLTKTESTRNNSRVWKWIMSMSVIVLVALALLSLPMYFLDVDYTYVKLSGFPNNQGFSRRFMRLWGMYNDANTAGVYSMVGIFFALYLSHKTNKRYLRILLWASCIPMFFLLVLANSRTVQVAWATSAAWIGLYIGATTVKGDTKKRVLVSAMLVVIATGLALGAYSGVKGLLPQMKVSFRASTPESARAGIHRAYDQVFRNSTLNITEGYYQSPSGDKDDPDATETEESFDELTEESSEKETRPEPESLDRTDYNGDISNGRFQKWSEVLAVFRYKPLFGASPRGISAAAKQIEPTGTVAKYGFAAHNAFLEVLAGTGILGFSAMLVILVGLVVVILRLTFTGRFNVEVLLYSTVLLAMVCEMMFISDVYFGLTFGGVVFWMAAGWIQKHKD